MKKFIIAFSALLLSATATMAQAPRQFSYQTVVRNSGNALVANSSVGIRISILKTSATGVSQYSERHTVTTNANGLASLTIGTGTQTTGSLANIEWINDNYFVKTEVDPAGGTNYSITGTSQLLAAPYALNGLLFGANGDPTLKGGGTGWTRISGASGLSFWANNLVGDAQMHINAAGNVGIGTSAPTSNLEVRGATNPNITVGTAAGGDGAVWLGNSNHGIKRTLNDVTIQTLGGGNTGMIIFANGGDATPTERMRIFHNGNVGIGTPNPTAKLHINGGASRGSGTGFAFYSVNTGNQTAFTGYAGASTVNASIFATDRIIGGEFNAMSDARMKKVIGQSNSNNDLSLLNKVKITDYTHIDAAKTPGQIKKVIAQELEQVYPQAVSKTTNVVPDIYSVAAVEGEWLMVKNNLSKGEKVRIIQGDESTIMDVTEANSKGFKVKGKLTDKQVFVYGRQVEDFRVVDYEALSTLNISATQELAKQVEALKAENARLQTENKEVKTSLNTFQTQMEAIQAKLEVLVPAETAKK